MKIEWSDIALENLTDIKYFISKNSPIYANIFIDKILNCTNTLQKMPEIGRRVPEVENNINIREIIFHNYRIIYQIRKRDNKIFILTVTHASRNIDTEFNS